MNIDLRSDTCTLPTQEMREIIYRTPVGDQAYGEDIVTIELEKYCAKLFNKDAALFMPSGTMSDQVGIKTWINSGEEIILHQDYHVNYFQSGTTSELAHACLGIINSEDGFLSPELIQTQIESRMRGDHFPEVGLILIENTINGKSGKIYPKELIKDLYSYSKYIKVPLHIDGERILNACVATGNTPSDYGNLCDSITCSFSKGLGSPFGSILMGSKEYIKKAERIRRWYGGFMHQTGFMAAAALYAIKNNIKRLEEDHNNAMKLYTGITKCPKVTVEKPDTNIVMIDIKELSINAPIFVEKCSEKGIKLYPWTKNKVRAITHLGITSLDIDHAINEITKIIGKDVNS